MNAHLTIRAARIFALLVALNVASFGTAVAATAQEYPSQPIRMVLPFTPGSGADTYARIFGKELTNLYKQQVIADNRGGAGGIIGTAIAAQAAPNGYTIIYTGLAHAINAVFRSNLPYDSVRDFAPVSLFTEFPWYLVAHPSFAPNSVPELIALARSKPGQIDYVASSVGSAPHLAGEMFKAYSKIDIVHIPYKATAEATIAVLSGRTPLLFVGPSIMAAVKQGKLKALGVTSAKRSLAWPEVPTIQEGGVPNYNITQWHGILVPSGTPKAAIERLHAAVVQTLRDPEVIKILQSEGAEPRGDGPEQFGAFLKREYAKLRQLSKAMGGLKLD